MPISGKDLRKLFYDAGYELVPGGGKGSHWKLKRKGCPMVIIPNHKTLKPGTENALRKILKGIVGKIRGNTISEFVKKKKAIQPNA